MKKVGLCHGVFDVLHLGHILHFKQAKKFCDYLIVSVTTDKYVNKGENRPMFSDKERANFLKNIKVIDEVIISNYPTAVEVIKKIKPKFYFKDIEYKKKDITGNINKEINILKKFGGRIIYTNEKKYSSSSIINNKFNKSDNFIKNIQLIKNLIPKNFLDKLENNKLKPLLIGEQIKDEFIFCETLGKSGKDNILTVREIKRNTIEGGIGAIAKNYLSFCKNVGLISFESKKIKNKISNKIPKIKKYIFEKKGSPDIIKTKYVNIHNNEKFFGSYIINDRIINSDEEKKFLNIIKKNIKYYDFVVIADYDHGLITKKILNFLLKTNKKIICTLQLNSANLGYHDILKLNGSDLLIINSNELLNFYKRKTDEKNILKLSKKFINEQKYKNLIITLGNKGSYFLNKRETYHFPAITNNVTGDRIGSGDTFLVLASLGFIYGFHPKISMMLGTMAASYNLQGFGNEVKIDKNKFIKNVSHIIA